MSVPVEQAIRAEANRLAMLLVGHLVEQLGDGLTARTAGVRDPGAVRT